MGGEFKQRQFAHCAWLRVTSLGPHSGMASKKPECMIEYRLHLLPSARKAERSQEQMLYSYINNMSFFLSKVLQWVFAANKGGCSFTDDCINRSTHPLFGERVRCSSLGCSFMRLKYMHTQLSAKNSALEQCSIGEVLYLECLL